ncbi:hypothetical protein H0H87_001927 [Tephrocybe sp. NHM501043]|nr:hypothetical protein H0H87_001927 [Tephrocybe sp. NHM501043]
MDWDEYDLLAADGPLAGRTSFIDRARNAPPDDDDVAISDARNVAFTLPTDEDTPLQQLIRHWANERNSPDILPAQEELLVLVLDHIRRQSQTVQLLREDASTSEDEHVRIMLAQTEMERVKFIVRSYVRTRHYKDCPRIRLPDGTALEMRKDHISLVPYEVVEQLVARGEAELV